MLNKIKAQDKIQMINNKTQFAVENEGFRYALARCKKIEIQSFHDQANIIWNKTHLRITRLIEVLLKLKPFPTQSFANLRQSYQAVTELCKKKLQKR